MRITANTFPNTLTDQLAALNQRQTRLQTQAATGQRIALPADDPTAMRRVLDLQSEARRVSQYGENVSRLRETAQANYELTRNLKKVSDRAGEIAILGDGTKPPDQLKLYAVEVTALIKQAAQVANTQFRGAHLLGGTKSDVEPFVLATDANGLVTGVTYQGNAGSAEVEIAEGVTVSANAVGVNVGGTGPRGMITDSDTGADFFNHLISLQNHLAAGDTAAIAATDRVQLAQDEENFLLHLGENGALQARLEATLSVAARQAENIEVLVSNEVDVDLAQTLVRLNQTQNAYQAALQSGAQLLNNSLLDYLR